jgi:succinyl-CoA synthetase beta subunit
MMLLEHDAAILAADGVPVPTGIPATTADVAMPPRWLPPMVKAQVPVGGRGKAGAS